MNHNVGIDRKLISIQKIDEICNQFGNDHHTKILRMEIGFDACNSGSKRNAESEKKRIQSYSFENCARIVWIDLILMKKNGIRAAERRSLYVIMMIIASYLRIQFVLLSRIKWNSVQTYVILWWNWYRKKIYMYLKKYLLRMVLIKHRSSLCIRVFWMFEKILSAANGTKTTRRNAAGKQHINVSRYDCIYIYIHR